MPYETYNRKTDKPIVPPFLTIRRPNDTPGFARMTLNVTAMRILHDAKIDAVALLWDKENYRIALRAVPADDPLAFRISPGRKNFQGNVSAAGFLRYIGFHIDPAAVRLRVSWNPAKRMLEAEPLPRKCISKEAIK